MKKFLAIILTLVTVLSLVSAFAMADPLPGGYAEDNVYVNTDGGFSFTCPDGFSFDSAKDIAKANGITVEQMNDPAVIAGMLEEGKDITLMSCTGSGSCIAPTVTLNCKAIDAETAAAIEEMGEDAFLDDSLDVSSLDGLSQNGISIKDSHILKHTILGKEVPVMEFTAKILFVMTKKLDAAFFIRGDRLYYVTILSGGEGLDYLDLFTETAG